MKISQSFNSEKIAMLNKEVHENHVSLYPENVFMKSYRSVYIHQLGIMKVHRNKGIGRLLMNFINNFAKENGINKIQLDYWSDNESASQFYIKNGFKSYRNYLYKEVDSM
ncbi:GNAT family N-acetyltransferase [Paenibacillus sp. AK002]